MSDTVSDFERLLGQAALRLWPEGRLMCSVPALQRPSALFAAFCSRLIRSPHLLSLCCENWIANLETSTSTTGVGMCAQAPPKLASKCVNHLHSETACVF